MREDEIYYKIMGVKWKVFKEPGPGLFESVYEVILAHELKMAGLRVYVQHPVPLIYDGKRFDSAFRVDLLVEAKVIIEIKSIENISAVHHKQLLIYFRLSGLKLGLLVNINCADIDKLIFRKVNNL